MTEPGAGRERVWPGRIVILGGTGFIGSRLTDAFRHAGAEVDAFGSRDVNLNDPVRVAAAATRWDRTAAVILCAGITPRRDASWHAAKDNIRMAVNLAASIPAGGWRGLLFVSSSAVYGRPAQPGPMTEHTPLLPQDPYGFSKVESEHLLAERAWSMNTPFLALRPSIVFGRDDRGESLVGRWAAAVRKGEPVAILGRGAARIDLVTADDLCELIVRWARRPFGGAVNAASGQARPVLELLAQVEAALEKKAVLDTRTKAPGPEFDQIFDISGTKTLFPDWTPHDVNSAIRGYCRDGAGSAASAEGPSFA